MEDNRLQGNLAKETGGNLASIYTRQGDNNQKTQIVASDGTSAAVTARAQTPTGNAMQVQIGPGDVISYIPVFIDFPHHQIHEGESWQYFSFGTLNASTRNIRISVPTLTATTRTPHILVEVISDCTTTTVTLFEGTTWTTTGTDDSARIFNKNRNVGGSPNTKIYIDGGTTLTVNAAGTEVMKGYLFAGKASLTTDRGIEEWVLKSNTEYNLQCITTGNGSVLVRLTFYEDAGV